jgi:hypothetical protein
VTMMQSVPALIATVVIGSVDVTTTVLLSLF